MLDLYGGEFRCAQATVIGHRQQGAITQARYVVGTGLQQRAYVDSTWRVPHDIAYRPLEPQWPRLGLSGPLLPPYGTQAQLDQLGLCRILEVRSEEQTSDLQSIMSISFAELCLNKK